jgi:hypothetical protein
MTCPLEKQMVALLEDADIEFTRPERERRDPTNLDFHLSAFDLYIEVKMFHTDRIVDQLSKVPVGKSVIVLVGPQSVTAFKRLCSNLEMTNAKR